MVGHSWQPSSEDLVRSLRRAYKKEFVLVNVPSAEIGKSKIEPGEGVVARTGFSGLRFLGRAVHLKSEVCATSYLPFEFRVSDSLTSIRTVSASPPAQPAARQAKRPPSPTRRDTARAPGRACLSGRRVVPGRHATTSPGAGRAPLRAFSARI